MYNINVPEHVENESAYISGANARIRANAAIGARRRWFAAETDAERLHDWLLGTGEFSNWYTKDGVRMTDADLEANDGYPGMDADLVVNPLTRGMFAGGFGDFILKMRDTVLDRGALTEKQAVAVRASLARTEKWVGEADARRAKSRAKDQGSEFVGSIKERREWTLNIRKVFSFESDFGTVYINLCDDGEGNVIVCKGGKSLGEDRSTVRVKATIVKHEERDGVKQTLINRPALLD